MENHPEPFDLAAWRQKYAPSIIGDSPAMISALTSAAECAPFDAQVLITGETGTGKELLAKALWKASARCDGPFVAVNCPAVPPELAESLFFGHERGAFTGAGDSRAGYFQQANGGTIFLDELGEMKKDVQVKLLRAIQEGEIVPVGGKKRNINVRYICATNNDLDSAYFREDLTYRLVVCHIHLLPVRERREDIMPMVHYFAKTLSKRISTRCPSFASEAITMLNEHEWPGNCRQIYNTIYRLVMMGVDRVESNHLLLTHAFKKSAAEKRIPESDIFDLSNGIPLSHRVDTLERLLIAKAIKATDGNKNQAAHLLMVNRTTLVEKMRRLEIT